MKVAILAGGLGTRLSEETIVRRRQGCQWGLGEARSNFVV